jgi:hypothetical protein
MRRVAMKRMMFILLCLMSSCIHAMQEQSLAYKHVREIGEELSGDDIAKLVDVQQNEQLKEGSLIAYVASGTIYDSTIKYRYGEFIMMSQYGYVVKTQKHGGKVLNYHELRKIDLQQ